ncbi:hypothetical protein [Foetidibacter luteolus]|uniref:hypothetical protein n=1 Tax=Foetidibacter luteolus TaxID=2608880 RepID=UPI00129B168A|nr:hypothetical protein [Foetidibacter luteolus]
MESKTQERGSVVIILNPLNKQKRLEFDTKLKWIMQNLETFTCKWKEHIRKRPGMYIGDMHFTGFKHMLEYFFEEILEDCSENLILKIDFFKGNTITIKLINADTKKFLLRIEELQSTENKMQSLGIHILTTLSSDISIAINDQPNLLVLYGQKGDFKIAATTSQKKEKNIVITFTADKEIFKDFELVYEHINTFLRQFALLNQNLKIISTDKTTNELQRNIFCYPTGIFKQLDYLISQHPYCLSSLRIDIDAEIDNYIYKIGISYVNIWCDMPLIKTYAGNIETPLGGSLNEGILNGLILSIKKIAQKESIEIVINRKLVKKQLVLIAVVKGKNFQFKGSTKTKLGMPKVKKDVTQLVYEHMKNHFDTNKNTTSYILNKFKKWE